MKQKLFVSEIITKRKEKPSLPCAQRKIFCLKAKKWLRCVCLSYNAKKTKSLTILSG